jgi:phage baseplate assembly protein V
MDRLLNVIKMHADALIHAMGRPRFGTVASVDPSAATVRVILQPEGVLTGWLPILSLWTGEGWGMVCPPSPGDQVMIIPQEGQADHGVVIGRAFSNQARPPAAPVGEFWLVHGSGSFIKLQNDGTIRISGDLHVAGDVYDQQGALSRLRMHYDTHTHTDSRGGVTSITNEQD